MTQRTRRKPKPTPAAAGRPPAEVGEGDWKAIERMARAGCTHEEMADFLGISKRTFYAPHLKDRFQRVTRMAWAATRLGVRERQLKAALKGHPVAQIWWGKQHLGQTDRSQVTGGVSPLEALADVGARLADLMAKAKKNETSRDKGPK